MQTQLNKIKVAQSPTTNGSPEMLLILLYYVSYSSAGTIKSLQRIDSALWRCEQDAELGIKTRGS